MPVFVIYFLIIPSTLLFFLLAYIILTRSPKGMNRYKYMILALSIAVSQFDIIYSLLCMSALLGTLGMQFNGLLGISFPSSGNYLALLYFVSIMVALLALAFSVVWREYALIPFSTHPLHLLYHFVHFAISVGLIAGFFPMFWAMSSDYENILAVFKRDNVVYNPNCAIFTILFEKTTNFYLFLLYVVLMTVIIGFYVLKAFIRIKWRLSNISIQLSEHTVNMHRMLVRSLKIQIILPCLFFGIPLAIISKGNKVFDLLTVFFSFEQSIAILPIVFQVMATIPALFSTVHFCTVIYFTTPYRNFLVGLFAKKSVKTVEVVVTKTSTSTV